MKKNRYRDPSGNTGRMYKLKRWCHPTEGLRAQQLKKQPLCERCGKEGVVKAATTVNHRTPHRGDPGKFWTTDLESLCGHHHSSDVQIEEVRGYARTVDNSGLPLDPNHPFNKQ